MKIVLMAPDYRQTNPYQTLLQKELELQGLRVHYIPLILPLWGLRKVHKIKNTVFHFHWIQNYYSRSLILTLSFYVLIYLQILFLKITGFRLIWTIHNLDSHDSVWPRIERIFNIILAQIMDKLIVHNNYAVTTVSEAYKVSNTKIKVIRHGGFENIYHSQISSRLARSKLDLPQDKNIFLVHGQLRPYKGLTDLIESWQSLAEASDLLLIVGKGNLKYISNHQINPNIIIINKFIPNEQIHLYYSAADAGIFSHRKVFTSGSLYLMATYNKPFVAPKNQFFEEILIEYPELLYERNDIKDCKRAINYLREFLRKKENFSISYPTWHDIAKSTVTLYGLHENEFATAA